ncbi:MAG: glycosyltransferase [Xanthobacteraceae bacterium]|jgi:glycosyltransferase involved in cell wall biosynthesis
MRVLHVIPSYLPAVRYGGPIFAVHALCRALAARGHHVEVFTTNVDGPGVSAVPLATPVPLDGVRIRYFAAERWRRLYWAPRLARTLKREVSRFDIVHTHSAFLWPTWAAARLARNAHVPYLMSPRGMLVRDLIGRRSPLAKRVWIELFEKNNLKMASVIHATSDLEATELRRFGWPLPPIAIIPNGVDEFGRAAVGEISADVKEIAEMRPYALFLGRISWKKGLDRLLRAFARTSVGHLAIVGPNDEALLPHLAQLARDLQISRRVRFLPRSVTGADKDCLYASAQLFVLPSYSENFGNTVLEAMQHACPVVVTPEVGAAEIVRQAGGGLIVDGDPAPLGAAIASLMTETASARAMGEAGRQHIAAHYDWRTIATRMEALYAGVIERFGKAEASTPRRPSSMRGAGERTPL